MERVSGVGGKTTRVLADWVPDRRGRKNETSDLTMSVLDTDCYDYRAESVNLEEKGIAERRLESR